MIQDKMETFNEGRNLFPHLMEGGIDFMLKERRKE